MNVRTRDFKKICVLIPCYNEERGIEDVLTSFPRAKLRAHNFKLEIIVIDNNSSDKTAEIARSFGATVINETKQGKGYAIRTGLRSIPIDTDYIVMLDGDGTYRPEEMMRLIEPLDSGFCNVVIGSRLGGKVAEGSMKTLNRLGNWLFTFLVRVVYRVNVTDVLTGYFAWTHKAMWELRPTLMSEGFSLEMEMVTKMARLGHEIYSVPITYTTRSGESSLRPIYDGFRILSVFLKSFFWYPDDIALGSEPRLISQ